MNLLDIVQEWIFTNFPLCRAKSGQHDEKKEKEGDGFVFALSAYCVLCADYADSTARAGAAA